MGQLSAGHGHKWAMAPFNNLQIPDDKAIVEGDGAKGPKSVFGILHEFDPNLGNIHSCSSLAWPQVLRVKVAKPDFEAIVLRSTLRTML